MTKYVLKRIGMALLTLLIIVFLLFLLVRIMLVRVVPGSGCSRGVALLAGQRRGQFSFGHALLVIVTALAQVAE